MRPSILLSAALTLVALVAGCSTVTSDENANSDVHHLNASPITLENFVSHPKIERVRDAVAAIDTSTLTKTERATCAGKNAKFTDDSGLIRVLVMDYDDGQRGDRTTGYYDATGKRLFGLVEMHLYNEQGQADWFTEYHVYFGDDAELIFQANKDGPTQDLSAAPYRLPEGDWETAPPNWLTDPEAWYASDSCPNHG